MFREVAPTEAQARDILDRMGSTGQPPERGALWVNAGTDEILDLLRDEFLRRMRDYGGISTFKLVQAPFGGGKSQFLNALREVAWEEGFLSALVELSPSNCPFHDGVAIYRSLAERLELPPLDMGTSARTIGIDRVLESLARQRIADIGPAEFGQWIDETLLREPIESRIFARAVAVLFRAIKDSKVDILEIVCDFLRGMDVPKSELSPLRLSESLRAQNSFQWMRSLAQVLRALDQPGVVLLFDEMDRAMSFVSARYRQQMGDNLRQMVDACGQSQLPGVLFCYAVPPEFQTLVVQEYAALQQRLKGSSIISEQNPLNPIIDLEKLPIGSTQLLQEIGGKLIQLARYAYPEALLQESIQQQNISLLIQEIGSFDLESGTRRQFVKAAIGLLIEQVRGGERELEPEDTRKHLQAQRAEVPGSFSDETSF